ncbi:MAG: hypothetical protein JWP75_3390 [Frondihabitans sp.]|nr:hypothetical protein [Frondihabitans sp.]
MHPAGIQALLVMTNPRCIQLLNQLMDGVRPFDEHASILQHVAGLDRECVRELLDGLVSLGLVATRPPDEYWFAGEAKWREVSNDAWRHIHWLRSVGDGEQALDCELALEAAWDARSLEAHRRRRARVFRESASGRRFSARLADRTLGIPAGAR